jgi:hypothetical protein
MKLLDVPALMTALSIKRKIFHSEADFQHALAWEIHELHPELSIRLEYRHPSLGRQYLDLWVTGNSGELAIELKYWTRALAVSFQGEPFALLNQGAQDLSRYDLLKDVQRLETLRSKNSDCSGIAITLTNEHLYWTPPSRAGLADHEFRVHQDAGYPITGVRSWAEKTSEGTMKGRESPIRLEGVYHPEWRSFSEFPGIKNGTFRWLMFNIPT